MYFMYKFKCPWKRSHAFKLSYLSLREPNKILKAPGSLHFIEGKKYILRTSGKIFFKLFLWYFLKIFDFYNKIIHWQAHISHPHPNLDFFKPSLTSFFLSSFVLAIFFFTLLACSTWFLTLLAFIFLEICSHIYPSLCFSFDIIQLFPSFF